MEKEGQGFLTDHYEIIDNKSGELVQMRTIEIKSNKGKPLMVCQSKDTPDAIVSTLEANGWKVIASNSHIFRLTSLELLLSLAAQQSAMAAIATSQPNIKKSSNLGCLFATALIIAGFVGWFLL